MYNITTNFHLPPMQNPSSTIPSRHHISVLWKAAAPAAAPQPNVVKDVPAEPNSPKSDIECNFGVDNHVVATQDHHMSSVSWDVLPSAPYNDSESLMDIDTGSQHASPDHQLNIFDVEEYGTIADLCK